MHMASAFEPLRYLSRKFSQHILGKQSIDTHESEYTTVPFSDLHQAIISRLGLFLGWTWLLEPYCVVNSILHIIYHVSDVKHDLNRFQEPNLGVSGV